MAKPTLTVRGEGRVEGPPELATVSATVRASGRTAAQVTDGLAQAARRVDAARPDLVYEGVYTEAVNVYPVFDQRRAAVVTGYAGQSTTRLVLADLTRLSDLVVALSAVPDTAVEGPSWSLRPTSPLYAQARLAAVRDAYARAHDYAAAVDGALGELVELSDVGGDGPTRFRGAWIAQARGAAEPPSFDFTPEPETVTAEVAARFRLVEVQGAEPV